MSACPMRVRAFRAQAAESGSRRYRKRTLSRQNDSGRRSSAESNSESSRLLIRWSTGRERRSPAGAVGLHSIGLVRFRPGGTHSSSDLETSLHDEPSGKGPQAIPPPSACDRAENSNLRPLGPVPRTVCGRRAPWTVTNSRTHGTWWDFQRAESAGNDHGPGPRVCRSGAVSAGEAGWVAGAGFEPA